MLLYSVETNLAIKRIRPYASDDWDARHTLREIRLMKLFRSHPNVISLYRLSCFDEKAELYMYMELMDCDLHRIIQSKQDLSEAHIKCFARQLLEGINALHKVGVFHRDIKPGNILVSKDCQLRITDFGLARFMHEETLNGVNSGNPMTEYVVTRWYRCPELLLAPQRPYSAAVDIWSIGCILGELIRRKPLFPGKGHTHQIQLILEVQGYSSPGDLGFPISEETKQWLKKKCIFPGQSLSSFIPSASRSAIEMMDSFLKLDPSARPSADTALNSAWLHDAQVICDYSRVDIKKPSKQIFDFEKEKYSLAELRAMIKEEIRSYDYNDEDEDFKDLDEPDCLSSGSNNVVYRVEGKIVDVNADIKRPKSAPDSGNAENAGRVIPSSSSVTNHNYRRLIRPSSNEGSSKGKSYDYGDNDAGDFDDMPSTARTTIAQSKAVKGNTFVRPAVTATSSSSSTTAATVAPVAPSPKKIDTILAKDAKIKRRFFLQNLLSSKNSTHSDSSANQNPQATRELPEIKATSLTAYNPNRKNANLRAGIHDTNGSSNTAAVGGSNQLIRGSKGTRPSLLSAIRGSLMGKDKKPIFHGSIPK